MQQEWTPSTLIQAAQEAARQRIREDQRGVPPAVAAILGAIEQGLFDPDFSVAAARRACGATQTTVLQFQKRFATTIQAYVRHRRLEVAKELVDDPRVDLKDVARALGFGDDTTRLSRWFKKWTDKTPIQRRREVSNWPDLGTWVRMVVGALRLEEAEELLLRARAAGRPPGSAGGDAARPST